MRSCVAPSSTELSRPTFFFRYTGRFTGPTPHSLRILSIHILNRSILTPRLHGLIAVLSTQTPPKSRLLKHHHQPHLINNNTWSCNTFRFNTMQFRKASGPLPCMQCGYNTNHKHRFTSTLHTWVQPVSFLNQPAYLIPISFDRFQIPNPFHFCFRILLEQRV